MEPDGSIESASVIRVVVLQVGEITASAFRTYSSLIMKHRVMPLQGVFGYYKEHQKSPFSHQVSRPFLGLKRLLASMLDPLTRFQTPVISPALAGVCFAHLVS
ncbi:unnamed protein product [Closterium sp. NIES-53]